MTDQSLTDFARHLFGRPAKPDAELEEPKPGNHVPGEGNNPPPGPPDEEDMQLFVQNLFADRD